MVTIGSSSSPCDDHVYSWQPRQITFAASVQEIASDYVAAQSQHLIDASSLFRATVFGQSKHASYVLKPRTTLLKRRPSLWSLVSQVSLPPRLGWKRWLEDASVLKRCPHSAAAHHFAFLFLLFFFFWNVSVSTSWAYRSSRHSSYPLIRARVCPRQTPTDGCWVCPRFFCVCFF